MDTLRDTVTILLIEDDPSTVEMLRPALENEGYRVHHAPATPSAQALAQLHPDLLVIDLASGGQTTNWQVVREVADRSTAPGLPIIVYGGDGAFVAEGDVRTYSRATAVLARPVRLDTLLPVVSQALMRRRQDWRMDVPFLPGEPLPESSWGW
jgi:DNA-binding NtrC family response regulator